MRKGSALLGAFFVITALVPGACARGVPVPHGISGTVFMSDGITQVPSGTRFTVSDTASGYAIKGITGGPPGMSGRYSVPVSGEDGDEVIIRAWNGTHSGTRKVALSGDMAGLDVVLNTPLSDGLSGETVLHEKDEESGIVSNEDPANIEVIENSRITEIPSTPAVSIDTWTPGPAKMTDGFGIITALAALLFIYTCGYKR